ncbi:MBOAT family O-acyltransferase, partial [Xanthovirga aplysinae]|uniref:MBOAT family O-acyltransferase n=1 Tax=Xanthovirga aplysinae TaxID=2529853 RepID=UPI0012BB8657
NYFSLNYSPNQHSLLLPVGISFYTFQTLSYTIDGYRGCLTPEKHLGKFALYVSFFPQLVAGPIERAKNLLPQFHKDKLKIDSDKFISGFTKVLLGFFKKVVVADTIAIQVDSIYNNYELHTGPTLLMATYLFAFQIYCDFSGYSDIAIGLSRMMGYDLMENFKLPYFSKSVTEFWRRWHISLSSWLKDYLYIPLGGSRKGNIFTYRNLMTTMLLGGLWHGASWNFVIWGGLNGLFLSIEKGLYKRNIVFRGHTETLLYKVIRVFICFNLICLSWVFFRAETLQQATDILKSIFSFQGGVTIKDTSVFANLCFGLMGLLFVEYFLIRKKSLYSIVNEKGEIWASAFCGVLIIFILLFGVSNGSQFIYFQF